MSSKVVYITGGTKGIGYGIAEVLLKNNYKVAISGRSQEGVDTAVESLNPNYALENSKGKVI